MRLNVTSGSLLDTHYIPSSCSLRDLEFAIGIATPWDFENKHRLEIPRAQAKRTGETMVGPADKAARKQSFECTAVMDPSVRLAHFQKSNAFQVSAMRFRAFLQHLGHWEALFERNTSRISPNG